MRKISLEARVLGSFGLLVAALVAGSLLLVHFRMEARVRESVEEQLTTSRQLFEELLATRAESLIAVASLIAELPALRGAAEAWEPEKLARAFREITRLVGSEVLIVTDRMGVILGRSDRRWEPGEIFAEATSVARALRGHRGASMWVQEGRLYQMVSVAVRTESGLAGTLSMGYGVDAELARELGRLSGNDIAFVVGERIVASSRPLSADETARVTALTARIHTTEPVFGKIALGAEHPAIVVSPFFGVGEQVGAYAVVRSIAREARELARLERQLALGSGAALLAVLGLGFLLSRSITRPLTVLSSAVGELAAGNYDFELPAPSGSVEVEELTSAFEAMRRSLRARISELRDLTARLEEMVLDRTAELEKALAENRRLLAELQQWSDELERKVEARSRELAEAHQLLVRQDRMAAIGRLAAGVAHEINNPLGILSGFAEGLRDRAEDPSLRAHPAFVDFPEHLRLIRNEVERLQTIVQKFLRFARTRTPRAEWMDVNDVAREVLTLLGNHALRERKTLEADLAEGELPVEADPEQLKQVLLNLALNGLDAVECGGHVWIRTARRNGAGEIRVEDDGPGIPPEVRKRLFEPFFSTKPPEKGTGLGLSLCWDLVKENGGELEVAEGGGRGAAFVLRMPLAAPGARRAHA
ncbi:MAG: ATP-binding protein [Candidatus Binatia bacterium]